MRFDNCVGLEQRGSQKRAILAKSVLTICTALVGSIATTSMTAQVQLPTVNLGDTNFEDASLAQDSCWRSFQTFTLPTL